MLMSAASQLLVPLDLADLADLTVPRAAYDPAPPLPAPSRGCATPTSPATSPTAPGPKHARWPQLVSEILLSTSSFIARPAPGGYNGVVVHDLDRPIHKVPLLLAAFQYRFNRDVDAMAQHIIDSVDNFLIITDGSLPTRALNSATIPPTGPSECRHR
ncbi:hypothetical protein [Streptomyces sp. CL12]|uniref:hypothetical protein n=1 Tax=Streptomyces sp. CL12 TaxID=3391744 RepID=UPI003A7F987A